MDRKEGKRTQRRLKPNRKDMKLTATFNRRKNCILKKALHSLRRRCLRHHLQQSFSIFGLLTPARSSASSSFAAEIQSTRKVSQKLLGLTIGRAADPSLVSEAVKNMVDASLGWEQLQTLLASLDKQYEVAEDRLPELKAMMMEMTRKLEDPGKNNVEYPYNHQIHRDCQIASLGTQDSPATQHCYDTHEGSTPLPVVSELTSDLEFDDFDPLIYLNVSDEEISSFTADLLEQVDTTSLSYDVVDSQCQSALDVRDPLPARGSTSMEDNHQLQELPSLQGDCSDLHQDWSSLLLNSDADNHCPSVVWGYPVFGAVGQEMIYPYLVDFNDPTTFTWQMS